MLKLPLIMVLSAIAFAPVARADDFLDGLTVFQMGDMETGLRLWGAVRDEAEAGDPEGQLKLGLLYENGWTVPQDRTEAVKWYEAAAAQGDWRGYVALARCYNNGWGVEQNEAQAFRWYLRAAESGHVNSQETVSLWYEVGRGVPQDFVLAYMWLSLAASQRSGEAAIRLRDKRDNVGTRMTANQIADAQRLTREWKPAALP